MDIKGHWESHFPSQTKSSLCWETQVSGVGSIVLFPECTARVKSAGDGAQLYVCMDVVCMVSLGLYCCVGFEMRYFIGFAFLIAKNLENLVYKARQNVF